MIPEAIRRGLLVVLPDRSGFFVVLDPGETLACPSCRRVMGLCLLLAPHGHLARWSYRCLSCPEPEPAQAVAA